MNLGVKGAIVAVLAVFLLIVGYGALFTVYQTKQAIVVRLGNPVRVVTEPGLNYKIPLIDSVILIDKRILDLENPAQEVIASDQKRLVVDAFARYKIVDALRFYQVVNTPERANGQLSTLLNSALRRVLGEATLTHVVRDDRAALMARVREQLDREAQQFGIQVIDVRIRRADLPEQNSQAVYQRMQTERQREAAEFRAQGSQKSQEIRARADRDVTVLVADATSRAEQLRGTGDAERLQQGPGLLLFLPVDAGLRSGSASERHASSAQAGLRLLPLLRRCEREGEPAEPSCPRRAVDPAGEVTRRVR
jgi:membrane protease subunit HflC